MRNAVIFLTVGIATGFLVVGCGQASDTGTAQSPASAETEEGIPEGAEMVSLKVKGMT